MSIPYRSLSTLSVEHSRVFKKTSGPGYPHNTNEISEIPAKSEDLAPRFMPAGDVNFESFLHRGSCG